MDSRRSHQGSANAMQAAIAQQYTYRQGWLEAEQRSRREVYGDDQERYPVKTFQGGGRGNGVGNKTF